MRDLNILGIYSSYFGENFIDWYFKISLFGQIIIIISIIAIIIAAMVLVYYILKGLIYLLYYLFKGLYFLFKGIFSMTYQLLKELYYRISGKPNKEKIEKQKLIFEERKSNAFIPNNIQIKENYNKIPYYCTECGNNITETMRKLLLSHGIAYCFHCGKEYKINT